MLPKLDENRILQLIDANFSIGEIANELGARYDSVCKRLKKMGVSTKKKKGAGRPPEDRTELFDKMYKLYRAGWSDVRIGLELGYSPVYVGNMRRTKGWLRLEKVSDEKILQAHREERSNFKAAEKVGLTYCSYMLRLNSLGIKTRRKPAPPKEELLALIDAGKSIAQIANHYDVGAMVVRRWRREYGITHSIAKLNANEEFSRLQRREKLRWQYTHAK